MRKLTYSSTLCHTNSILRTSQNNAMEPLNIFKATLVILVFASVLQGSEGIIDIFIHSLLSHLFGQLFEHHLGPATRYALGGPTVIVKDVLAHATPLLTESIFGERFDNFVFSMLGGLVSAAVTGIAFAIEGIARAIYEPITKWVEKGVSIALTLLNAIATKIELAGAIASIVNLFSRESPPGIMEVLSNQIASVKEGRSLAMDFGHMGNLTDQTNPLADDPALRRFLGRYDDDQCLEQLFCTLYASHPSATTQEERSFMKIFNRFDKRGWKYVPGMKKAARFGSGQKMIQKCQKKYSNCHFPLLVRASFIYSLKQTFKTR